VLVDSSGNVYVTGITRSLGASNGAGDVLLLKYDSSGNLLWQKTWGGLKDDSGQGIAMDSSGNIYVAGFAPSFGAGGYDVAILKFDSSGTLLWQKTWGGNKDDFGYGVSVDSSGSIYVTGRTDSFGAGLSDVFLLRLDSSGNLVWQKTWGGVSYDEGRGITLDSAGHIYVTGLTSSFGTGADDGVVLKFDSSGNLIGQTTWGGSGGDCVCGTPSVDSSGDIFVTGYVTEAPPYSLGSGNLTLGTPSFTLGTPTFALRSPSFTPITPSGTVGTPSGSESYAGAQDLFLFKYAFSTPSPDFQIRATPASTSVLAGAEAISTITVTSLNGFSDSVSLGISISPGNGLTCTLSQATITGGSGSATLSCSGSYWGYTVTVTGTSGALSHAVPVSVVVQDYTVTASSSSITTNAGTAGTATIDISPHDGFTGTVNLSSAVNASGLTCTVTPTSVSGGSGSSTLSCSGSAGAYSVDITTTSDTLSHHVQVSVSVAAASAPQPAPQTIFGLAPIIFYGIIGGIAVIILGSSAVILGRRRSRPT
jgi:hypothetical protein